jgi:hypothetical protein
MNTVRKRLSRRWMAGLFALAALAVTAVAAPTMAVHPSGTIPPDWAWAVESPPGTTSDASLPPTLSGSSWHMPNGVHHDGRGIYTVTFPDVGATAGGVQVSALGPDLHLCLADAWIEVGGPPTDEQVVIRCYTPAGTPANSGFVVNWLTASDIGGRFAYAANLSPTDNCGTAAQQFDSFGGTIGVCVNQRPNKPTRAELQIPHLGSSAGIVQVSALAHTAIDVLHATPGFCDLSGFHPVQDGSGFDEYVDTLCYNLSGPSYQDIYRQHDAWFMQDLGMEGNAGTHAAYAFADRPAAASYAPPAAHAYNSSGAAILITRTGRGAYTVQLNGQPAGGSAEVTATGDEPRLCVVASISYAAPQRIGVRCFGRAGGAQDTAFTLSYAR